MTNKQTIQEFLAQPALAVVGVSRSGKKFGNTAFRELKAKGYRVYPVHPEAQTIEGESCYPIYPWVAVKNTMWEAYCAP